MLENSNGLFLRAQKEGYAIPAYNVNNLEWAKIILETCNFDKSPVILSVSEKSVHYFGGYKTVVSTIKSLINDLKIKIPVVLHLDHASCFLSCKEAIDSGFTSIMIDLSKEEYSKNVEITSSVVCYAKKHNVTVEAELGIIGDYNSRSISSDIEKCKDRVITSLWEPRWLAIVSWVIFNSFAPSIGNVHGFYSKDNKLDFELLGAISKEVKIPLVLHGASNLDANKLKTAIFCGVCKVNFNTDLMYAWSKSVRKYLNLNKEVYDPRDIILSGADSIRKVIHLKNEIIESKNKG